jgi:ketosteroid isomerase-like protein
MSQLAAEFERAWGRFCAAFEAGDDEDSLGALQAWIIAWDECVQAGETGAFEVAYHEDVEAVAHLRLPGMRDTPNLESLRRELHDLPDIASRFRFDVVEFERHGDLFMGSGRFRARGRYSGLVMRFPLAVVWTYRDGRISRVEAYGTRRRARSELLATPAAV